MPYFELYQIEMAPCCEHASIGHLKESTEYIMMVEGEIELEVNGKAHTLCKDDGFCFDAIAPHIYRNKTDQMAKAVLMIYYKG